jgi:hypothetical protein
MCVPSVTTCQHTISTYGNTVTTCQHAISTYGNTQSVFVMQEKNYFHDKFQLIIINSNYYNYLEGVVGIGWSWLRIGTGGGHLCVR